jgi:mycothiol synthase
MAPPGPNDVTWRAPSTADAPAWTRLRAAIEAVDRTGEVLTDADVADELADPGTDPADHARFAFTADGEAVAWGWVFYVSEPTRHHRIFLDGAVHPEWRGRGLGTALTKWLEQRADAVIAAVDDDLPAWLELRGDTRDTDRIALFTDRGFTPLRHFLELRRDLSTELPSVRPVRDVVVGPYDAERDEALRAAHNEAFLDQWGSEVRDRASWERWFTGSRHFRPDLSLIALDGNDIAGYVLSMVFPDDAPARGYTEAWTSHLGVRRPWRGRGLATALLTSALHAYASAGLEYASLDVDAENPTGALALYRRLGYETRRDVVSYARGPGPTTRRPAT